MRTIIDLPKDQIEAIKLLSKAEGVSRAEIIRRAIAKLFQAHPVAGSDSCFGIWKNRKINSKKYQRQLRDEWE